MGYGLMLGLDTVESVAHVIQVALTPVFLLSGMKVATAISDQMVPIMRHTPSIAISPSGAGAEELCEFKSASISLSAFDDVSSIPSCALNGA
jgi:hypothetical protein